MITVEEAGRALGVSRSTDILARHTDKDWTLCDAISFAVLDARHITRAFTFDHHFRRYGRIQVLGLE